MSSTPQYHSTQATFSDAAFGLINVLDRLQLVSNYTFDVFEQDKLAIKYLAGNFKDGFDDRRKSNHRLSDTR